MTAADHIDMSQPGAQELAAFFDEVNLDPLMFESVGFTKHCAIGSDVGWTTVYGMDTARHVRSWARHVDSPYEEMRLDGISMPENRTSTQYFWINEGGRLNRALSYPRRYVYERSESGELTITGPSYKWGAYWVRDARGEPSPIVTETSTSRG